MRHEKEIHPCSLVDFPDQFQHMPKAPEKLSAIGSLPSADYKYVTIVGSRKHSDYARETCERLIAEMSGFPVVIVSGLAYGIDACAHRAALRNNITTMAFPGSGLDDKVLYPAGHRQLANEIVAAGGCLVSEFSDTQPALPWTFPVRNRLMAGIADVVIVIEAREKSGSLITAREAADYGRTVMVVPGPIYDERCTGSNQLLFDGAIPILNGNTILHELGFSVDAMQLALPLRSYTHEEQQIIDCLYEPKTRGELSQLLNIPMAELNQRITMLEIQGYVKDISGNIHINT